MVNGLGLDYLRGYWARHVGNALNDGSLWVPDQTLLCGLGLNGLETLRYLHAHRPSFGEFEDWIVRTNGGALDEAALDRLRRALAGDTVEPPVYLAGVEGLSADDLAHWSEHGYVIVRDAVTAPQAKAAEAAIYEYLGAKPDDPDSWYGNEQGHSIWVRLLRHPAFAANRQSARLVKAFAQLWGRADLWVTVDQGGLNPPERPGWAFPGPHLHWDTTLAPPHHFGLQGLLYLADVAEDQGAFTCVPGFHKRLPGWLAGLPEGKDPRVEIMKTSEAKPIAARAGDAVIWHHHLPHGSSPNRAQRPRVAQYITMHPTRWNNHEVWR